MRWGVCGNPGTAKVAAAAGYDYFEASVANLLCPESPEEEFRLRLAEFHQAPLPCSALNVLLPKDLKIVGPATDPDRIAAYVAVACRRAKLAGVAVLVFGSGGARHVPDGWSRAAAQAQLHEFGVRLGDEAGRQGLCIAVEPLNRKECNVLNTVGECAEYVRAVNHPSFRLLVDGYHWAVEGEAAAAIIANGDLLAHVHVATVPNRLAPGAEECDLAPFFAALREVGYAGRVSIEGNLQEPQASLPRALARMRELWAGA